MSATRHGMSCSQHTFHLRDYVRSRECTTWPNQVVADVLIAMDFTDMPGRTRRCGRHSRTPSTAIWVDLRMRC